MVRSASDTRIKTCLVYVESKLYSFFYEHGDGNESIWLPEEKFSLWSQLHILTARHSYSYSFQVRFMGSRYSSTWQTFFLVKKSLYSGQSTEITLSTLLIKWNIRFHSHRRSNRVSLKTMSITNVFLFVLLLLLLFLFWFFGFFQLGGHIYLVLTLSERMKSSSVSIYFDCVLCFFFDQSDFLSKQFPKLGCFLVSLKICHLRLWQCIQHQMQSL